MEPVNNNFGFLKQISEGKFGTERLPEFYCGNTMFRPNYLKLGERCGDHVHNFDHTTFVVKGSVHVKAKHPDGTVEEKDFDAISWFLVKAETRHEITALEDDTLFVCVYCHRDPQGRITQEVTGWEPAYS